MIKKLIIPSILIFLFCTVRIPAQVTTDSLQGTQQVSPIASLTGSNTSVVNNNLGILQSGINNLVASVASINTTLGLYFSNGVLSTSHGGTGTSVALVPSGAIIMWHGSIASIPSGWVLCDGSNSTPDLRNRFIVGADADDSGVAKSTITGSALQTSNGQLPATSASVKWPTNAVASGGSAASNQTGDPFGTLNRAANATSTSISSVSFGTGSLNVATFYALAYIMKI